MRNNKAILDEAARSVRRTFISSVAGSTVMLAVVGAAGAYGMPEKLTAQAISAAMAKLNFKLPAKPAHADSATEQLVRVAENARVGTVAPVSDVVPDSSIVRTVVEAEAEAAPPSAAVVAVVPAVESTSAVKTTPPVVAAPVLNPFNAADAAPAPTVTASLTPSARPNAIEERPLISAPMVFEAPKPADAQVLTELPKTEVVVAEPERAAPKQAETLVTVPLPVPAPIQQASLPAEPSASEFPKTVTIRLPEPKPPMSPAQRLDLSGKDYDKAEKCLAQAIYFEARNEPARGQQAVAQVVLNRVFSPYYPKDVCSVVYQNAHRHLSCQFTFACDGKPDRVNERGAWQRASRIAMQTLNAKVWLPEVNKATHYHAAYVRPNWIRDMKVMAHYGLHTFYRPRNWGDGSDEAQWATPANSVKPEPAKQAATAAAQKKVPLRRVYARHHRA